MRIITSLSSVDNVLRKTLYDSVVRNLISGVGLDPKTSIKYEGDLENNFQPLSTEGFKTSVDFGDIKTITVQVDEEPDAHSASVRSVDINLEEDIFFDPRYGLKITPICETFNTKLTLSFRTTSKDEAKRLVQRLRTRINSGEGAIMTGGEFSYPIPHDALQVIIDLHTTACEKDESGAGPVDEFFLNNLAKWVTVGTKQNGKGAQFIARKQISGIHLIYDHEEPTFDKRETNYTTSFSVSFRLERPSELRIEYPVVVAGSPMPEDYWPELDPPWIVQRTGYKNPLIESEQYIDDYVLKLPWHFTVDYEGGSGKDTVIFFSSDCAPESYDENNPEPYCIIDLNELPFGFTPEFTEYLKYVAIKDKHMLNSIFKVGFHVSGLRVEPLNVWLDENLHVWSDAPYRVWKRNQFTLELVTELSYDSNKTIDSLREFPKVLWQYIDAIAPSLTQSNNSGNGSTLPSYPGQRPSGSNNDNVIDWDNIITKDRVPVSVLDDITKAVSKEPTKIGMITIHNNSILVKKAEG